MEPVTRFFAKKEGGGLVLKPETRGSGALGPTFPWFKGGIIP